MEADHPAKPFQRRRQDDGGALAIASVALPYVEASLQPTFQSLRPERKLWLGKAGTRRWCKRDSVRLKVCVHVKGSDDMVIEIRNIYYFWIIKY